MYYLILNLILLTHFVVDPYTNSLMLEQKSNQQC